MDKFEQELIGHPDRIFVDNLITGLREGFFTGIMDPPTHTLECPNNLSARIQPETVKTLIENEVKKGYLVGPFNTPPFSNYRVSPLGVAEGMYSGKKRLIVDLSAPHNDKNHVSLNQLINKDD